MLDFTMNNATNTIYKYKEFIMQVRVITWGFGVGEPPWNAVTPLPFQEC